MQEGAPTYTMKAMRYTFSFILIVLISAVMVSGCNSKSTPASAPVSESTSPTTSLTGTFRASSSDGSKGVLSTSSGPVEVESLVVDLKTIDGETVTVTGKYSGDTLFVSQVE